MNKQKVEFIESYIKIGNGDYQWNDNHGELIRCKDCKHNGNSKKCIIAAYCELKGEYPFPFLTNEWFCADGERK